MNGRWLGPVAVAGVALSAATALYLLLPEPRVWIQLPLGSLMLGVGLLTAGGWALALGLAQHQARVQAEARQAGAMAERDAHRRFLARLDHELKNPVTAIRAAVASARADAPEGTRAAPQLAIADAQSARLSALVGDLRKLAELETQPIEAEDVDVEEVAHDAVADLTAALVSQGDRRSVTLHFPRVPWPLPRVRGDVDLLYLAIHNLLSNAAKYSATGSPIEVRGIDEHGWVVVEVADVGMGIPEDELPVVLDELARGREARGIPGSGLGLALVRVVAERHSGTLTLRSRHGEGTSARLWLPVLGSR